MSRVLLFIVGIVVFCMILLAKPGSCQEYAELVCLYCGEESDVCSEIRVKAKEHPEDPACKKGLRLLPTVMEGASEEGKAKVLRTLCKKEIPEDSSLDANESKPENESDSESRDEN